MTDPSGSASDTLGFSIAFPGDLSGDGAPEFLAGSPGAEDAEDFNVGKAILFSYESDCDSDGQSIFAGDATTVMP